MQFRILISLEITIEHVVFLWDRESQVPLQLVSGPADVCKKTTLKC